MTGAELILHMHLRDKVALIAWRKQLSDGRGVYAACAALGVAKTTVYRHAKLWPEFGQLIEKGTVPPSERGAIAAAASHAAAAADPRIIKRRNRAIKKARSA